MKIRWYGQSAFALEGSVCVAIDPFGPPGVIASAHGIIFDYPPIEGLKRPFSSPLRAERDGDRAGLAVGAAAVEALHTVRADICVLGICSLHPDVGRHDARRRRGVREARHGGLSR